MRIGHGWDVHRLVEGRKLVLGGVEIPFSKGESGHSDGDVVFHALMDALLGAAAFTDIGDLFPDTDSSWKDADSAQLMRTVLSKIIDAGLKPHNIDITIILEEPRLAPYREKIRSRVAELAGIGNNFVGIKAKTCEGLGETGSGRAVECHAVVLLEEMS